MSLASSVQSLESRDWSSELEVWRLRFKVQGSRFKVQSQSAKESRLFFALWSFFSVTCFLFPVTFFVAGCGRKTPVRPPELVAPEPIDDLTLEIEDTGIKLQWRRPQRYVDGSSMDDLGGFVVLRATLDSQGKASSFTQIATIPVEDQDRFRKAKEFSYTDEQLAVGTLYRYRVQAFTLDSYYSSPSNTVELVWKGGS